MKKLALILCLMMLMTHILPASAQGFSPVYHCTILEDGTVRIDYVSRMTQQRLTLPDVLEGRRVSAIAAGALNDWDSLVSVTFPDCLTTAEGNPFEQCTRLEHIAVNPGNAGLATIDGVLYSKADKRLVCRPAGKPETAFAVPEGIRIIGDRAFSWNTLLTDVTLPATLERIGAEAFSFCESLGEVKLPEGVTALGDRAFQVSGLTAIALPRSLTEVGANPFNNCDQLTRITVAADHPVLEMAGDALYHTTDKRLICHMATSPEETFVVREGTERIGVRAMGGRALLRVELPASLRSLDDEAFIGSDVRTVVMQEGVETIGSRAFRSCSKLTSVVIPASVTMIGEDAFGWCPIVVLTVTEGSYGEAYAREHKLAYAYPSGNDWLLE